MFTVFKCPKLETTLSKAQTAVEWHWIHTYTVIIQQKIRFACVLLVRKSTCIQTIKIQGSLYSTYKQSLQSPFYSEVGQYNTPCNHTFIGIPSGSYVSFFMPIANLHSTSASWIYATPRNSTTFLYYNHPLIAHVGTGTSATLQMPGISDSSWRFTYEFRGETLNS